MKQKIYLEIVLTILNLNTDINGTIFFFHVLFYFASLGIHIVARPEYKSYITVISVIRMF